MLWRCYLLSEPKVRCYRQRFHNLWLENTSSNLTEQNICDQRRTIEKKGWLTEVEKEIIQRSILADKNVLPGDQSEIDHNEFVQNEVENNMEQEPPTIAFAEPEELEGVNDDEIVLSPEDLVIFTRLKELVTSEEKPIFNLKTFNRYDVMAKTTAVNNLLKYFAPSNITETRNLIQAASSLVGELLGAKKPTGKPKQEPWWKRRIEKDIDSLRKDLSVIESWFYGNGKIEVRPKWTL